MEPILPVERVKREAREAAAQFADVNDACPYPFHSDAGRLFREEFARARTSTTQDHQQ
jgi:hypothetical protein